MPNFDVAGNMGWGEGGGRRWAKPVGDMFLKIIFFTTNHYDETNLGRIHIIRVLTGRRALALVLHELDFGVTNPGANLDIVKVVTSQ